MTCRYDFRRSRFCSILPLQRFRDFLMIARAIFLAFAFFAALATAAPADAQTPAWSADITAVRKTASLIPGARPLRINVLKFAESRRTKNFSIKGAPKIPSIQARTAFQVVYRDGTVMVDSGMDLQVHKFFGRGQEEPYFPDAAARVDRALRAAKLIVMTHEHGDHVAGVIRTPLFAELAGKTILTRTQVKTLMDDPQMPEIRLSPEMARKFIVIDYDNYFPLAPGMALINSPGHTPGSQMIYVALDAGNEFILAGDVAWHMDGVRTMTGKDAPWVKEDEAAIADELKWLNQLTRTEKNLNVVLSHDEEQRLDLINRKILGDGFE
jgi:glyoxylase-like metal-dependent hydrolase (beta-lactamase superfamily II)